MPWFGPATVASAPATDTPATRCRDLALHLVAPAAGTYSIEIRDTNFGGGPGNTYALHVGDFPRPSGVFPPGGQAGTPVRIALSTLAGGDAMEGAGPAGGRGPVEDGLTIAGGRHRRRADQPRRVRSRPRASRSLTCRGAASAGLRGVEAACLAHRLPRCDRGRGDEDETILGPCAGDVTVSKTADWLGSLPTRCSAQGPVRALVARNDDDVTHDSRVELERGPRVVHGIMIRRIERQRRAPGLYSPGSRSRPRTSLTSFLAGSVRKSQSGQVMRSARQPGYRPDVQSGGMGSRPGSGRDRPFAGWCHRPPGRFRQRRT